MPTYILLTTLTAQGVQTLRANPDRLREVNRDVEELGARVLHQWAVLGPFDFVNVVEAPDDATIAKVSITLGARGSAKIQSLSVLEGMERLDRARHRDVHLPSERAQLALIESQVRGHDGQRRVARRRTHR